MILSMSSDKVKTRITITVDPDILTMVQEAVDEGAARSVSAFFERAALGVLDAHEAYIRMLDDIIEETGGPPTPDEIAETERRLGLRP